MKPLVVLVVTFVIAVVIMMIAGAKVNYPFCGRIAMAAMLVFTAIGHFAFTKGMMNMLPEFIPFKKELVYITGLLEIVAAIGLLFNPTAVPTGWFLVLFFIVVLPANIYAAMHHIDYQKGTNTGPGVNYIWFRVPLQVLFIVWVYYFAIRP